MPQAAEVVLVFPPGIGNRGSFRPHLGIAYLQAALARAGIRARQQIPPEGSSVDDIVDQLIAGRPRVVGLTVYDSNVGPCLRIAQRVKETSPQTWVVFGGPAATFSHEYLLSRHQEIDLCVRGETEETGPELLTTLLETQPAEVVRVADLPGVAFRDGPTVQTTGLTPLAGRGPSVDDRLDSLPSPYLDGMLEDGRAGILTGRGCVHSCVYCCFAALARKQLRLHSVDRVVAELQQIAERTDHGSRSRRVTIFDDAFTLIRSRAKRICEAVIAAGLQLPLACITRADTVDRELLEMMRAAGFMAVAFGLESAVPSVLRAIGKVRPPDWSDPDLSPEREFITKVEQAVRWAHELELVVGVSIMLGLPTETPEHAEKTMSFVSGLPLSYYMHNTLSVFPGTPLWQTQQQLGIESPLNVFGLPATARLPYDVSQIKPAPRSNRANEAQLVRQLALDGLYACEAPHTTVAGLTMAVVRADSIDPHAGRWLAGTLSVGGTVIQVYSGEGLTADRRQLLDDREVLAGCGVPYRHHIQLLPDNRSNGACTWKVLSEVSLAFELHLPEVVSFREQTGGTVLGSWLQRSPVSCDVYDACHELRNASRCLLGQLEGAESMLPGCDQNAPPVLAYPGRWADLEPGCTSLSRIEIDAAGSVRVCRHGGVIGTVGEPLDTMRARLLAACREARAARAVDDSAEATPPACPFPGLPGGEYCALWSSASTGLRALVVLSRMVGILTYARDELE